jgi:hypothetical protein
MHFALKHYVKVENWDKGRGGLRIKVPEAKETNAYLEQVKFTMTNITSNYRVLPIIHNLSGPCVPSYSPKVSQISKKIASSN